MRLKSKVFAWGAVGLAGLVIAGLIKRTHYCSLPDGGVVRVTRPGLLTQFFGSRAEIAYRSKSGGTATIGLLDALFENPIILMPSGKSNTIYCLYEFDVRLALLRIELGKPPVPRTNDLRFIVLDSSCGVSEADAHEWRWALREFEGLASGHADTRSPPILYLGVLPLHFLTGLFPRMRHQIDVMFDGRNVRRY